MLRASEFKAALMLKQGVEKTASEPPVRSSELVRCRRRGRWRVQWYGRNGCIRQTWCKTLKEAWSEYWKHKDAEVYDENPNRDT